MNEVSFARKLHGIDAETEPDVGLASIQLVLHLLWIPLGSPDFLKRRKGGARRRTNDEVGLGIPDEFVHSTLNARLAEVSCLPGGRICGSQVEAPSWRQSGASEVPTASFLAYTRLREYLAHVGSLPFK